MDSLNIKEKQAFMDVRLCCVLCAVYGLGLLLAPLLLKKGWGGAVASRIALQGQTSFLAFNANLDDGMHHLTPP